MDQIEKLRNDINNLDNQIMELLNERFHKSILVGNRKKISKIDVLDSKRENEIINKSLNYERK